MKRAAIYVRVSTDDQVSKGASLDTQTEKCKEYVTARGDVVLRVFREEGYSGSNLERPELTEMRELIKARNVDYIVALDTDRLARRIAILGMLEYEFEKKGVQIHYVNTSEDPLARIIKGIVGEIENLTRKERSTRNKIAKAKSGRIQGTWMVPFGYDYEIGSGKFTINEKEARIVRMMYNWRVEESLSFYSIAKRLNTMSVPTKRLASGWGHSTIRTLLTNTIYFGEYRFRQTESIEPSKPRTEAPRKRQNTSRKMRDASEVIIVADAIPPIVSGETWKAAQLATAKIMQNRSPNKKHDYLLTGGIFTCGVCGYKLVGSSTGSGKYKYFRYMCGGKSTSNIVSNRPRCKGVIHRKGDVEAKVWAYVSGYISDPNLMMQSLRDANLEEVSSDDNETLTSIMESETKLDSREKRLVELYMDEGTSREIYQAQKAELDKKKIECQALKSEILARIEARKTAKANVITLQFLAESMRDKFHNPTFQQKRKVLEALNIKVRSNADGSLDILGMLSKSIIVFTYRSVSAKSEEEALDGPPSVYSESEVEMGREIFSEFSSAASGAYAAMGISLPADSRELQESFSLVRMSDVALQVKDANLTHEL